MCRVGGRMEWTMKTNGTASYLGRVMCALALALVAGFAFTMLASTTAYAAKNGADTTYKVRVWAGNEGTVNGKTGYDEITGLTYGQELTLSDEFEVAVSDKKYYFKGYRVSGQDDGKKDADGKYSITNLKDNITVTEDTDFIVSYGVKGSLVPYTLHFVEYEAGKTAGPNSKKLENDEGVTSKTFYGNLGDKPVVAFEYVPGYRPRYSNITGTLGEEGTNNWYCEYIKEEAGGNAGGGTAAGGGNAGGGAVAGGGAAAGGTAAGGTAGTTGGAAGAAASAGAASAGAASAGAASAAAAPANPPQTEELLDVDNPLASQASADKSGESADKSGDSADKSGESAGKDGKTEGESEGGGFPIAAIYGIAAALVGAIAVVLYLLKRRRDAQYDDLFDK